MGIPKWNGFMFEIFVVLASIKMLFFDKE